MNPTIESWNVNPAEVGPMYPWAGWEVPMFLACLAFCIGFLAWKFRMEKAKYAVKPR